MTEYIFTFYWGQKNEGCYHVIKAESLEAARETMNERYGSNWSRQCESRESAGVDKYNLREIKWEGF